MKYEFDWVTDEMVEALVGAEDRGDALDSMCEQCPYRDVCSQEEVYFSCILWEEYMGEDL